MIFNIDELVEKDFHAGLWGIKDSGGIEIIGPERSLTGSLGEIKGKRETKMNKMFCGGSVKGVDSKERTLVGVASSDALDRDREVILKGAWGRDLDEYRKNPVLMLSHNYAELPIGVCLWIKENNEGLIFKGRFASPGINPVADVVSGLYGDKVMSAFSVGFQPLEFVDHPENTSKIVGPLRTYSRCKLLEISCVAIGSNPEALALVETSIKAYRAKKWPIKPGKTIVPQRVLDRSLYDDDLIEVDDCDAAMMLKTFSKMPPMIEEETNRYLAEYGINIVEAIGDRVSLLIRRAQGRAF